MTDRVRITLLCEFFYPDDSGSTPTDLGELIRFLADYDSSLLINVITSRGLYRDASVRLPKREAWQGVDIVRVTTPRSKRRNAAARLVAGLVFAVVSGLKLVRGPRPDVVLVVTNPPVLPLVAMLYRLVRRVPFVYLIHDLYPDLAIGMGLFKRTGVVGRSSRFAQSLCLNGATRIVVLGRCMKERLVSEYGLPEEKIVIIDSWGRLVNKEKERLSPNGDSTQDFEVAFVGNIGEYLDLDTILAAAKELEVEAPHICFRFVGDGSRKGELARAVEQTSSSNIEILPRMPRAAAEAFLASADVALVPLHPSLLGVGVPSKLYSTMAAGTAAVVMAPPTSEIARVVEEQGCGVNVGVGDPQALAKALLEFASEPEIARAMGARGRDAIDSIYTLGRSGHLFLQVLTVSAREGSSR